MEKGQKIVLLNDFRAHWDAVRADTLAAVEAVGASGHWILGPQVENFEAALARFWGIDFAVGCANGTDALELALHALDLAPGQKVLTTPLSAFASTLAILRAGGKPVFVDVDRFGLVDLDQTEIALKADPEIRFFLPVHLYGHALDLDRLQALRDRYDLKIVEDCAQSIGARSENRVCGSVGQIAGTSFYPTKNLGAMGDGGALLTGSEVLANRCKSLRNYGQTTRYEHALMGMNSRLDELHAAILERAVLPRLAAATETRKQIAQFYLENLHHPDMEILGQPEKSESVWHLFPVLVRGRQSLQAWLTENGVQSGVHYPKGIPFQDCMADQIAVPSRRDLERSEIFAANELSLPIHAYLSQADRERVVDACNRWPGART